MPFIIGLRIRIQYIRFQPCKTVLDPALEALTAAFSKKYLQSFLFLYHLKLFCTANKFVLVIKIIKSKENITLEQVSWTSI
jgi:hypothetical protein